MTFNDLNEEQQKAVDLSLENVEVLMNVVSPQIDSLTSSSLKRVLKATTHSFLADSIINNTNFQLSEEEQGLIDNIFKLQEAVLGYMTLSNELGLNQGELNESEMVE